MQQLRTIKYKLENSKTHRTGYFHIFKKNISENGSEIILGIIEDDETGNLYEIPIADFSFVKEVLQKQTKKSIIKENVQAPYKTNFDESEHDDLPY